MYVTFARRSINVRALAMVTTCVLGLCVDAQAQLVDAFAGHFGASRLREPGIQWSASLGMMLLTQYDSRWVDGLPNEVLLSHDGLATTVGYNYAAGGGQLSWPSIGPGGRALLQLSGSVGLTWDGHTEAAQDGLHNFRRFPHVFRPSVANGIALWGGEVEASHWWSWYPGNAHLDVFPAIGIAWSNYHREASLGGGGGVTIWKVRLQGEWTHGWLLARGSLQPAAVGSILEGSYSKWSAFVALDRRRFGGLAPYIPSTGLSVAGSTGLFQGEPERLLSIFFDFPALVSNHSWRLEVLNDLLFNKDRGPTGGLRLTYVAR